MLIPDNFAQRLLDSGFCEMITKQGYAILPQWLPKEETRPLSQALQVLWDQRQLKPAAIGQGEEKTRRSEIRGDYILWLEQASLKSTDKLYFPLMEASALLLNQHCLLGIRDLEAHFTVYPPGAAYKKHQDRFKGGDTRILSTVLYLNEMWGSDQGGSLLIYTESGLVEVLPEEGTLVFFLSDFWHEVRPALRERKSVTGWFLNELKLF